MSISYFLRVLIRASQHCVWSPESRAGKVGFVSSSPLAGLALPRMPVRSRLPAAAPATCLAWTPLLCRTCNVNGSCLGSPSASARCPQQRADAAPASACRAGERVSPARRELRQRPSPATTRGVGDLLCHGRLSLGILLQPGQAWLPSHTGGRKEEGAGLHQLYQDPFAKSCSRCCGDLGCAASVTAVPVAFLKVPQPRW